MLETKNNAEKSFHSFQRQNNLEIKASNSIKRNQVRGFIHANSTSTEVSLLQNDENSQLAEHLLQLKTSCSGVKVQIQHREMQQYKYKDETAFAAQKAKAIQEERYQLESEIAKLRGIVDEVKTKKLSTTLAYKSYEHILDRMKKDEIKNQLKRNQLEKELRNLEKNYRDLNNKSYDLKQFEYLSANGLKQAQGEINELGTYRKATLATVNSVLEEKNVLEKKKQERKDKTDMIKQIAAGDLQDADLIRMKKFLTVQNFLKAMLKRKIQKLKDFYESYQLAFLKIKSHTSVKDASTLKAQFRNFENTYSEKSAWVKHLQQEIARYQQIKKDLNDQYRAEKDNQLKILEQMETSDAQKDNLNKKELQEKAQKCAIKMMAIRQWLKQQSKKMGLDFTCAKTEAQILKEICEELRKKKVEQTQQI